MSRKKADLIFSILILAIAVWMVWEARDWGFRARLFPWAIGYPAIGLALLQLGFAIRHALAPAPQPETQRAAVARPGAPRPDELEAIQRGPDAAVVEAAVESAFGPGSEAAEEEEELPPELVRRRVIQMTAWILAFAVGVVLLGFKVSSALTTFAFLRFGAHETWKTTFWLALGTYLFFFLVFDYSLSIPLPPGWVAESLGLQSFDSYLTDPVIRLITRR